MPPFLKKRWVRVGGTVILFVGLGMTIVWFTNTQKVPIAGRTQLVIVSDKKFIRNCNDCHEMLLQEMGKYVLAMDHPTVIAVKEVFDHLLQSSGLEGGPEDWEVFVVNAPSVRNASVLYNRKVWVYSGLLDVAGDTNEMGNLWFWGILGLPAIPVLFAPVMMSHITVLATLYALPWVAKMYQLLRSTETEADYIGLTIMAQAGYDIQEAVEFWGRMELAGQEEKKQMIEEKAKRGKFIRRILRFFALIQRMGIEYFISRKRCQRLLRKLVGNELSVF
ncbi:hypothetical protein EAF04_000826 [Stromatinia cepivora]|nr:hypothetical protein EAF04_000826 [Stromatinia cepivora]